MDKLPVSKLCSCGCGCRTIVSPLGGSCGGCLTGLHGGYTSPWVRKAVEKTLPPKVYA